MLKVTKTFNLSWELRPFILVLCLETAVAPSRFAFPSEVLVEVSRWHSTLFLRRETRRDLHVRHLNICSLVRRYEQFAWALSRRPMRLTSICCWKVLFAVTLGIMNLRHQDDLHPQSSCPPNPKTGYQASTNCAPPFPFQSFQLFP